MVVETFLGSCRRHIERGLCEEYLAGTATEKCLRMLKSHQSIPGDLQKMYGIVSISWKEDEDCCENRCITQSVLVDDGLNKEALAKFYEPQGTTTNLQKVELCERFGEVTVETET